MKRCLKLQSIKVKQLTITLLIEINKLFENKKKEFK